jgi:hypothetical protein
MGCKCGRDILFGETNEIIKAQSLKKNNNKKNQNGLYSNNNPTIEENNNTIKNISDKSYCYYSKENNNQYNNKEPELNLLNKNDEESPTINNINGSQRSSLNMPLSTEISKKNDYPQKIISLINEIRSNPLLYSKQVEDSIKNIEIGKDNQIIYHNIVKVALHRGEQAFREAINILRNTEPMQPLRYNPQLCIPLPENEIELKNQNFLKEQVDNIKQRNTIIEIYFKDLIKIPEVSVLLMIVDDNSKNISKKRETLLNKDFRYIGVMVKSQKF